MTNPKSAAAKGKPRLSLIPGVAMAHEAIALAEGADKYGVRNYLTIPVSASEYIDAALRHIEAWKAGEDNDPTSGASHLGHARASLAIALDAQANGNLVDDRLPPAVDDGVAQFAFNIDQSIYGNFSANSSR